MKIKLGGIIMKKLKEIILKYPFVSSIIIVGVAIALTSIPLPSAISHNMENQFADYLPGIIEQAAVSILLVIVLKKLGLYEKAGFSLKIKNMWLVWPILIFILLNASDMLTGEIKIDITRPLVILAYLLVYLSTGFFEEILCRGLVFSLLINKWGRKRRGCYMAMIISSIVFGMAHFIHYFLGDASLIATIAQTIYATFIGVFFVACVIRNHSIYPAIILHGILDIAGSLRDISVGGGINKGYITMPLEVAAIYVIITLPLFLYGFFIVRKEFRNVIN
jgi:membrane protease YdiL (CAAX protease family)